MNLSNIFVISNSVSDLKELSSRAKELTPSVDAFYFGAEEDVKDLSLPVANLYLCKEDGQIFDNYAFDIAEIIKEKEGSVVFVNNTISSRSVAARLATYIEAPTFANVHDPELADEKLVFNQTVYGGAGIRKITFSDKFGVLTFNSGSFEVKEEGDTSYEVKTVDLSQETKIKLIEKTEKKEQSVNLAAAKNIVDAGRGIADEKGLALMEELAKCLNAEIACTRPVAENLKLLPKSQYLGVTGVQIKPSFLFAVGASGQIQHIAGIDKSKFVLALNKDKSAPIFKHCDVGIVGDMHDIIPKIIEKLS